MSLIEDALFWQFKVARVILPEREWVFHPERKWRFDFAWPERMIAAEIQGGNYVRGRHTRPAALEKEYEKINAAAELGWRILYFTPRMVDSGVALGIVTRIMGENDNEKNDKKITV